MWVTKRKAFWAIGHGDTDTEASGMGGGIGSPGASSGMGGYGGFGGLGIGNPGSYGGQQSVGAPGATGGAGAAHEGSGIAVDYETGLSYDVSNPMSPTELSSSQAGGVSAGKLGFNAFRNSLKAFSITMGLTANPLAAGLVAIGALGLSAFGGLKGLANATKGPSSAPSGPTGPEAGQGEQKSSSGLALTKTYSSVLGFDQESFKEDLGSNAYNTYKKILEGEGSFYDKMKKYFASQEEGAA